MPRFVKIYSMQGMNNLEERIVYCDKGNKKTPAVNAGGSLKDQYVIAITFCCPAAHQCLCPSLRQEGLRSERRDLFYGR
jgi:hypothetical protein